MGTTRQLTITLPTELADAISERVASGMYASESEVIQDSLTGLLAADLTSESHAQDEAFEKWLRTDVVESLEELRKHPERAVSGEQMRANLQAWSKARTDANNR